MVLCASCSGGVFKPPVASSVARLCGNGPKGSVLCILWWVHILVLRWVFVLVARWYFLMGCDGVAAKALALRCLGYHVSLGALGIGAWGACIS